MSRSCGQCATFITAAGSPVRLVFHQPVTASSAMPIRKKPPQIVVSVGLELLLNAYSQIKEARARILDLLLGSFRLRGGGFRRIALGVFASEALDAAGGVQQFLLAGKERMARRADFHIDVATMRRARDERISTGAVHPHFVIVGMDSGFHISQV